MSVAGEWLREWVWLGKWVWLRLVGVAQGSGRSPMKWVRLIEVGVAQ